MIINHTVEGSAPTPGSPEFEAFMGRWMAFNQMLIDNGHWISGASLAPSNTATTVRKANGESTIMDGPFAETKEQLGGYYVVEAANLDAVIEIANLMPIDTGSVEIRPVAFRPEPHSGPPACRGTPPPLSGRRPGTTDPESCRFWPPGSVIWTWRTMPWPTPSWTRRGPGPNGGFPTTRGDG